MELNATMKRRAGLAIENTYSEYRKEGGIADLETKLAKAHEGCSKHIFNLCTFVVKQADDLSDGTKQFAAVCLYAEAQLKEKHKIDNVKEALPVWGVYKSNLLRGMRLGLDPSSFDSEGAFRAATMEEVRASGPQLATTNGRGADDEDEDDDDVPQLTMRPSEPRTVNIEQAELMVESSTIIEPLKALVARLVVESEYIKKGREREAVRILTECVDKLHALIDQRKIRDAATKEALEMPTAVGA